MTENVLHDAEGRSESRNGLFSGTNPFDLAEAWLNEASEAEPRDANAIALATAGKSGLPNVRMVLLKEIEQGGFVFYTNEESAKGFELGENQLQTVFVSFKALADEKKEVFDEDIQSLIQKSTTVDDALTTYRLDSVKMAFESGTTPTAHVTLISRDGQRHEADGSGDGPIDAIYNAIDCITGQPCKLIEYQVMSRTKGKDAQGEVTVRLEKEGCLFYGNGAHTDIIVASAKAYIDALNKII